MLFDFYHEKDSALDTVSRNAPDSKGIDIGHFFFYNPVKPINLKTSNNQATYRLFLRTQGRFLQNYHGERAFSMLKTGLAIPKLPLAIPVHYAVFNQCYYSSPDDTPPGA
ncbi:hypothetical protein MNBD_BACTEROID01-2919 [hydrothermal vent metagenome]|uniref:Uncharacterized protein n=1 Tax=hydrothermal vent metagenome TaxID=652676 RepID=A0A3B0UA26_9ZZZZ